MGLQLCGLQVWCWLVSTVLWLVLMEQQLDLSSMTARLRGVVLVGLHYSLACACGVAVGPFVRDCETERWFLCYVVRVGYWRHEPVVHSHVVLSFLSDSCFATGCGLYLVTRWLRFYPLRCALEEEIL
ncbi:hypothetical protein Taro_024690 [Colocasia esculenta]|uniref:Uncharacterized protein n=1 Tax=Colocasia esculenta TaxID=4460 RepID=A0A843V862_COLES|nr:hypothetical protein [Colocasia esculenta]